MSELDDPSLSLSALPTQLDPDLLDPSFSPAPPHSPLSEPEPDFDTSPDFTPSTRRKRIVPAPSAAPPSEPAAATPKVRGAGRKKAPRTPGTPVVVSKERREANRLAAERSRLRSAERAVILETMATGLSTENHDLKERIKRLLGMGVIKGEEVEGIVEVLNSDRAEPLFKPLTRGKTKGSKKGKGSLQTLARERVLAATAAALAARSSPLSQPPITATAPGELVPLPSQEGEGEYHGVHALMQLGAESLEGGLSGLAEVAAAEGRGGGGGGGEEAGEVDLGMLDRAFGIPPLTPTLEAAPAEPPKSLNTHLLALLRSELTALQASLADNVTSLQLLLVSPVFAAGAEGGVGVLKEVVGVWEGEREREEEVVKGLREAEAEASVGGKGKGKEGEGEGVEGILEGLKGKVEELVNELQPSYTPPSPQTLLSLPLPYIPMRLPSPRPRGRPARDVPAPTKASKRKKITRTEEDGVPKRAKTRLGRPPGRRGSASGGGEGAGDGGGVARWDEGMGMGMGMDGQGDMGGEGFGGEGEREGGYEHALFAESNERGGGGGGEGLFGMHGGRGEDREEGRVEEGLMLGDGYDQ